VKYIATKHFATRGDGYIYLGMKEENIKTQLQDPTGGVSLCYIAASETSFTSRLRYNVHDAPGKARNSASRFCVIHCELERFRRPRAAGTPAQFNNN